MQNTQDVLGVWLIDYTSRIRGDIAEAPDKEVQVPSFRGMK